MNTGRIALLTDSGTDTPRDFCQAHDIRVMPLQISYSDGTTYRSGIDITAEEVAQRFATEIPKTSLPSPSSIEDALKQAQADGYGSAIVITIASALSATHQTVSLVASQMSDFPVAVIDSKSIGVAAGMQVMRAAEMIEEGLPFAALVDELGQLAEHTGVWFSVKDLSYLRQGGRISEAVYRVGSVLNIKPVITCDDAGYYVISKKARGWERALDMQVRLAVQEGERYARARYAICCSHTTSEEFDHLEGLIKERSTNCIGVIRSGISPDLLVHTGPDLVGVAVQEA